MAIFCMFILCVVMFVVSVFVTKCTYQGLT